MSPKSKSTIASMVVGAAILVGYLVFTNSATASGPQSVQWWATTILVFIGIGIIAAIIAQILFRIFMAIGISISQGGGDSKEVLRTMNWSLAEDEMDRAIANRAARVGYAISGAGAMGLLLLLAFGGDRVIALNILFGGFLIGSLVEGVISIYGLERGVHVA